jgi:hypothetical protein
MPVVMSKFRILRFDPVAHQMIVRYYSAAAPELANCNLFEPLMESRPTGAVGEDGSPVLEVVQTGYSPKLGPDGKPERTRMDFAIDVPIPVPKQADLLLRIAEAAPRRALELSAVKATAPADLDLNVFRHLVGVELILPDPAPPAPPPDAPLVMLKI